MLLVMRNGGFLHNDKHILDSKIAPWRDNRWWAELWLCTRYNTDQACTVRVNERIEASFPPECRRSRKKGPCWDQRMCPVSGNLHQISGDFACVGHGGPASVIQRRQQQQQLQKVSIRERRAEGGRRIDDKRGGHSADVTITHQVRHAVIICRFF